MWQHARQQSVWSSPQVELLEALGVVVARVGLPGARCRPARAQLLAGAELEPADVRADKRYPAEPVGQHVLYRHAVQE